MIEPVFSECLSLKKGESFSSWISRVAVANDVTLYKLWSMAGGVSGPGDGSRAYPDYPTTPAVLKGVAALVGLTWTMSTKVFVRQLAHFSDSLRYRAIAYDPRGQGLTSKTVEGHSYQQHGRDLEALVRALQLKRIVLVGWSFGVLDAMAYLDQFGVDNVRALVILDGTPKPRGGDPATEWVESEEGRRWGIITPIEDRAQFHHKFGQWLLEDASPKNVEWITEISAQTSATVTALLNETARHVDYESLLIDVIKQLPVLIVAREEWRRQVSSWLKANGPAVPLVVMGKHMMFWERADAFNVELDAFLDSLG